MIESLLVVDTETSSLDPKTGMIVEIAAAHWSVRYRTLISCWSSLVRANQAPAVDIPQEALLMGVPLPNLMSRLMFDASACDAIVAHSASFDRGFLGDLSRPWICSMNDLTWPKPSSSRSLVAMAVAQGVAVTHAHRALTDVMLIVRMLETVLDIQPFLAKGMRPKGKFEALVSYDDREKAKSAGFRWVDKKWVREMAIEDAVQLPFPVQPIQVKERFGF